MRSAFVLGGVMLAGLLAGCLGGEAELAVAAVTPPRLTAHDASGERDVPAAFSDWGFSIHPTGYRRGEPTIAVDVDGTIFTVGERSLVIRSRDGGATWVELDDGIAHAPHDIDPFLWLDRDTGRLFNSRLTVDCVPDVLSPRACGAGVPLGTWLSWTTNQGRTWDFNPQVGIPLVDHQKITTGPPPAGVATNGYPNLLYVAYNPIRTDVSEPNIPVAPDGVDVTVSLDGGRTFPVHAKADDAGCDSSGVSSPVVVTSTGTALLAHYGAGCDALWIARTLDGGRTWGRSGELAAHGAVPWGLDPMLGVDAADNVYATWIGEGGELYLSVSQDEGATWTDGVRVSAPGVTSVVFPDIVGGDEGRVAVAYLGTTAPDAWTDGDGAATDDPSFATDDAVWHLYVATIEDALAADPVIVTARATPDDDPVQIGCIWLHGGGNECRNLRDFMDMVEHDGAVYVVYPDGCAGCTTAEDSHVLGETTVVVQRTGPLLRDAPRSGGNAALQDSPTALAFSVELS